VWADMLYGLGKQFKSLWDFEYTDNAVSWREADTVGVIFTRAMNLPLVV